MYSVLNIVFLNKSFDKHRGYAVKYVKKMHFAGHDASLCVAAVFRLWLCIIVWLCEKRLLLCLEGYTEQVERRESYKSLDLEHRGKKYLGNPSLIRDIFNTKMEL
jgi:hypothetical protein